MKKYSIFFVLILFLVSCEPEKKDNTLSIKFNINAGTVPLQYDVNYALDTLDIQFSNVRFYISQPVFSAGAEQVAFNDTYFLGDAANANNTFVVGDVGKRTIDGIAFGFGVDPSRNTQSGANAVPAYSYSVDHPLSSSQNMYWSWNPGYIWMKLEGRLDANNDGDFIDAGETFSIHTGVDAAYTYISRTFIFTMNDAPKTIQIDMDVLKFFDSYDLVANPNAHPLNTSSPDYHNMVTIQNNAELVFGNFYE
jgi:hypothetical protein